MLLINFIRIAYLRLLFLNKKRTPVRVYSSDGIHLDIARNDDEPMDTLIWDQIREVGIYTLTLI